MTTILIGAAWLHVGARVVIPHPARPVLSVLAVVLAALITVGTLEVPH